MRNATGLSAFIRTAMLLTFLSMLVVAILQPTFAKANGKKQVKHTVIKQSFGSTPQGEPVDIYTLTNSQGMEARITNFGAILVSLRVPDKAGKLDDVALGFDSLDGYFDNKPHFGATVGRYANRIANGKFTLDGQEYTLARNNGPNSLHGGLKGFDKVLWRAEPLTTKAAVGVVFTYISKDGEEGYPGNLHTNVTYTLSDKNELSIEYAATTDKATPINLTHHSYFNLVGEGNGDILGHVVTINADRFTPTDKTLIPTGELRSVKGTPLDFTKPAVVGSRINDDYEPLVIAGGYDHNFVLNRKGPGLEFAARVHEPKSGRTMEVYTTEPAIQFYTGNFLDGSVVGKHGYAYKRREGLCLETQHYPDSPNHPDFPSTILRPGKAYESHTVYKFSAE